MLICRASKDVSMKKITKMFKTINIVKFNAWEDRFIERLQEARSNELRDLLSFHYGCCVSMPIFISLASFKTYALVLHREWTPQWFSQALRYSSSFEILCGQ